MKKTILVALSLFAFAACGQNSLNQPVHVQVDNPKESPQPPAGEEPENKAFEQLANDVAFYKGRYNMPDVYKKITDNRGNFFEDLYGTRNMREVLAGVYYRGGANNKYHKTHPRSNTNPLPADGLDNLCKDGFSTAIYYYSENYESAKKVNPCLLRTTASANTLNYKQISGLGLKDFKPFLQLIHDRIKGKLTGPIYGHCWNGWHASGFMASVVLKQFCGFTDTQADAYWAKNTDGNTSGYEAVRKKVKAYQPLAGFEITAEEKALICPK